MKAEIGKFYAHEAGRNIAIVGEVETTKWGKMLVVEEADRTGHSISCIERGDSDLSDATWVEIGKEEWLSNFEVKKCKRGS